MLRDLFRYALITAAAFAALYVWMRVLSGGLP